MYLHLSLVQLFLLKSSHLVLLCLMHIFCKHVQLILNFFLLVYFLLLHLLLSSFVNILFPLHLIAVLEIVDYWKYNRTKNMADFINAKKPDKLRASIKYGTSVSFHIKLYVLKSKMCLTFFNTQKINLETYCIRGFILIIFKCNFWACLFYFFIQVFYIFIYLFYT